MEATDMWAAASQVGTTPLEHFVGVILLTAQLDHATELVFAPRQGAAAPIRYRIGGAWYDMTPAPAMLREHIVAAVWRLAQQPGGRLVARLWRLMRRRCGLFSEEGTINLTICDVRLRWRVRMARAGADCVLTPLIEGSG